MRALFFSLCLLPGLALAAAPAAPANSPANSPAHTPAHTPAHAPAKTEAAKSDTAKAESAKVQAAQAANSNCVTLNTSAGAITLQLNLEKAPLSVANFLGYVDKGFYNGTIFHRVISDFMIQGGGFDEQGNRKRAGTPIVNESNNGLANERGTIAMARTSNPNSATSQFFINLVNNAYLNYRPSAGEGNGYAVFGRVVAGMATVDKIGDAQTHVGSLDGYGAPNVPVKPILITTAARVSCPVAK